MRYNFKGKSINIPDAEIEKSIKILGITKEEAIEMWLEDEGYLDNEEQAELEEKAKANKITATIHGASAEKKKQSKPKVVKVSDEKLMFDIIRASFNQRRKTLINGLLNAGNLGVTKEDILEVLEEMGLSATIRGEALTLEQFAEFSNKLIKKKQ